MKYDHTLIITYGRTGSTLLQGILNTVDGILIRGENLNICYGLFSSYKSLLNTINNHSAAEDPTHPFYGSKDLNENKFITDAYTLIKNQLTSKHKNILNWGFKEIRYTPERLNQEQPDELSNYLDFLNILFPNAAFIFLTREHKNVINSAFWNKKRSQHALHEIQYFEKEAKSWSKTKDNCFWIDYKHLTLATQHLEYLFNFLDFPFNKEKIKSALDTEHSYAGKIENLLHIKNREIHIHNSTEISKIEIDSVPIKVEKHKAFNFGGIVLPNKTEYDQPYYLVIEDINGSSIATWNIPSPRIAKANPSNPYSKNSRFKVENVQLNQQGEVCLFLYDNKNNKTPIATIKQTNN